MRKLISLTLCLAIVFCSFSLCFAAVSDQQAATIVSDLDTIKNTLNNIYSRLGTIMNYLTDGSHSIAYWVHDIDAWMSPIYNSLTSNLAANLNLEPIVAGLNEVVTSGGSTSYTPYLKYGGKSNANWLSDLYTTLNTRNNTYLWTPTSTGGTSLTQVLYNNPFQAIPNQLNTIGQTVAQVYSYEFSHRDNGYNSQQNALNWGNLGTSYFTPLSSIDGTYKWLATIQAPVARLSYVLASDERIAAQEAAAPVEQAVVDDFIDSSGDASASASDIGFIADLSAGYQQNFGSTASVTGIFNIFDSNNFGWFSSETVQQLDTTVQTRGSSYATPLLNKQLEEINNSLGVTNAN